MDDSELHAQALHDERQADLARRDAEIAQLRETLEVAVRALEETMQLAGNKPSPHRTPTEIRAEIVIISSRALAALRAHNNQANKG